MKRIKHDRFLVLIAFLAIAVLASISLWKDTRSKPLLAQDQEYSYLPILFGELGNLPTPTATSATSPTATSTNTPINTTTPTPTNTPINTPTATPTDTLTSTPTATLTDTLTSTPTATLTNTPTNTPAPSDTPTITPTPTNTPLPGEELLVYEWDKDVLQSHRGFPRQQPPINNFDWIDPVNYAGGTLYFYVEIFDQPVAQDMRLQFCMWQELNGDPLHLANCGPPGTVLGAPGETATWSRKVSEMWMKNDEPIQWWRPRSRAAVAIRNSDLEAVSDLNDWNWNGEDPEEWYPLDMHFMVVVVADGAVFSGWENYLEE